MRLISVFLFTVFAYASYAQLSIVILQPSGSAHNGSLQVLVQINSSFDIAQVVAQVGEKETTLKYSNAYLMFEGMLSLAGLPQGNYTLVVTATDVKNNSATATKQFIIEFPPSLIVEAPSNYHLYKSAVPIKASCTDLTFSSCKIGVSVYKYEGDYLMYFSTMNEIDTVLDFTRFNGSSVFVKITAEDNLYQRTTIANEVFIESSPYLQKVIEVTSFINDFDGDKIIYARQEQSEKMIPEIKDVNSFDVEQIPFPYENATFKNLTLTHNGAYLEVILPETNPGWNELFVWNDNGIHQMAKDVIPGVRAEGDFIGYNNYHHDLMAGHIYRARLSDPAKPELIDTGSGYFDLSDNGTVIYNSGFNVYTNNNGEITHIATNSFQPLTDGSNHVYLTQRMSDHYTALMMFDGLAETTLSDYNSTHPFPKFAIENGYVLFTRKGNLNQDQLWLREPSNEINQATFFATDSEFETLHDDGTFTFFNDKYRYVHYKTGDVKAISSSQGKAFFKNDKLYLTIGGTLLEVDTLGGAFSIKDVGRSMPEGSVLNFSRSDFDNVVEGNGPLVEISIIRPPKHGRLTYEGGVAGKIPRFGLHLLEYEADNNYVGADTAFWKASNGLSTTNEARIIITIEAVTAILEAPSQDVGLYPNPVNDVLTVHLKGMKTRQARVIVTNLQGQIVHDEAQVVSDQTITIATKPLRPGIFVITIIYEHGLESRKFVKL